LHNFNFIGTFQKYNQPSLIKKELNTVLILNFTYLSLRPGWNKF
jgi:hypothetical protein